MVNQKIDTANLCKNKRVIELENLKLEEENNHLTFELAEKDKYIKKIEQKLKNSVSKNEYEEICENVKELESEKISLVKEY